MAKEMTVRDYIFTTYDQLFDAEKKVADYLLSLPDPGDIYYAFFNENNYKPMDSADTQNWCGGTGAMIACDRDGKLYPCLRYMESSLGTSIKPLIIGDVDTGIYKTAEAK